MLNRFPLWKNLLILAVIALGALYAAPNLYPPDFAVQVSSQAEVPPDPVVLERRVRRVLEAASVPVKGLEVEGNGLVVRLANNDLQLSAREALARGLVPEDRAQPRYTVALNLAPTTPAWLRLLGAQPMKYGLDLSGGVHFLLQVDIDQAVADRLEILESDITRNLREADIRYARPRIVEGASIEIGFSDADARAAAQSVLAGALPDIEIRRRLLGSQPGLELRFRARAVDEIESYAINQNLLSLRNRVNELGVSEPLVQRLGANRIVLDLPGIQDSARAKDIIGKTANLDFRLVAEPGDRSAEAFDYDGRPVALERAVIVTGDRVSNAQTGFDPDTQRPQVNITLDDRGGRDMNRATRGNVGRSMAILFKEKVPITRYVVEDGEEREVQDTLDRERLISVATIQDALGSRFRITGLDPREASDLALLLRAGALAAPVYIVEERTVGASLGEENIERGILSVAVGFGLVILFMIGYYRLMGVAAVVALTANLMLLIAVMSAISATLTMPGIAGIVLTVGMAVDANVLIFARIREELAQNQSPQQAIHAGFERAFVTILDANVTTFIVAIVLYFMGSGPIKGFAVTLSIGLATSMFTAILGTRALVNLFYGGRRLEGFKV